MTYFLFKSAQPFSSFSETNEQQLIFIYKIKLHYLRNQQLEHYRPIRTFRDLNEAKKFCWQLHSGQIQFKLIATQRRRRTILPAKNTHVIFTLFLLVNNLLYLYDYHRTLLIAQICLFLLNNILRDLHSMIYFPSQTTLPKSSIDIVVQYAELHRRRCSQMEVLTCNISLESARRSGRNVCKPVCPGWPCSIGHYSSCSPLYIVPLKRISNVNWIYQSCCNSS